MTTTSSTPVRTAYSSGDGARPPVRRGDHPKHPKHSAHRRMEREKLIAAAVLLVMLAATLVMLAFQWLDTSSTSHTAALSISTMLGGAY